MALTVLGELQVQGVGVVPPRLEPLLPLELALPALFGPDVSVAFSLTHRQLNLSGQGEGALNAVSS